MRQRRDVRPELVVFGERLYALRIEAKLTQEQLAMKAGVERAYVSGAEVGRRNSTLTTIYKLAKALGIDPGDLIRGTGPKANG